MNDVLEGFRHTFQRILNGERALPPVDRPYLMLEPLPEPREPQPRLRIAEGYTPPPSHYRSLIIPPARVLAAVCVYFHLSVEELTSKDRHASLIGPRHIAYWLLRELCGLSYPEAGRVMGNRDHTTIMSGVRKCNRLRLTDPIHLQHTEQLVGQLAGGVR